MISKEKIKRWMYKETNGMERQREREKERAKGGGERSWIEAKKSG